MQKPTNFSNEPTFMSATTLARFIREKRISSVEAVKAYLNRIAAVNLKLNAVVQLCAERALVEASQLDSMLAKRKFKGRLHGVPMTVMDCFDIEGVVSTASLPRCPITSSSKAATTSQSR